MKQQLISEIQTSLQALHIHTTMDGTTDLTIFEEFLDASFSTGKKKITYDAAIFADENSSTIFMYEFTKEISSGFSFGSSSDSFSQTGNTLFRKVKSIQYSPDGKAYEYSLDLGAIPKAVKEVATTHNWKFKTVLTKAKASYPSGYLHTASSNPLPVNAQNTSPEKDIVPPPTGSNFIFCRNCGTKLDSHASFCKSCGQPVSTSAPLNSSSSTNYSANVPVKKKSKGCLVAIIIGILGIFGVLAIIFVVLISMSFMKDKDISYSSANISEAYMTSQIDPATFEPMDKVTDFSQEDTVLYATAYINNVPEGTTASSIWYYLPTGETMSSESDVAIDSDGWIEFDISNDSGFPAGDYKVEILINGEVAETLPFSIE